MENKQQPVAWAVWSPEWHEPLITFCADAAEKHAAKWGQTAVPLYRDPPTAVTASEREAIGVAIQCVEAAMAQRHPEEEEARLLLHQTSATLSRLFDRVRS